MGIIQNAMQEQGAMPPEQPPAGAPMPEQPPAQGGASGGLPPDQAEETYKRLGQAAMKTIYTKPESEEIVKMLEAGKDNPPQAVAQAAMAVIARLQANIKGIDPKLAFAVAAPIVVFLLEMAGAAKIFETDIDMIHDSLEELSKLTGGQTATGPAPGEQPGVVPRETAMPQEQQMMGA